MTYAFIEAGDNEAMTFVSFPVILKEMKRVKKQAPAVDAAKAPAVNINKTNLSQADGGENNADGQGKGKKTVGEEQQMRESVESKKRQRHDNHEEENNADAEVKEKQVVEVQAMDETVDSKKRPRDEKDDSYACKLDRTQQKNLSDKMKRMVVIEKVIM